MSSQKYDSRGCEFEIEDPANAGTYIAIAPTGITTHTIGYDYQATDTTTYGSEGQAETQNMQIAKSLKLEGFRLLDPGTGDLDPGQAAVEAQAELLSDASVGSIRFSAPGMTEWVVWSATAQLGDQGGGNNDKESWSVTFTRSGAGTTAAKS